MFLISVIMEYTEVNAKLWDTCSIYSYKKQLLNRTFVSFMLFGRLCPKSKFDLQFLAGEHRVRMRPHRSILLPTLQRLQRIESLCKWRFSITLFWWGIDFVMFVIRIVHIPHILAYYTSSSLYSTVITISSSVDTAEIKDTPKGPLILSVISVNFWRPSAFSAGSGGVDVN